MRADHFSPSPRIPFVSLGIFCFCCLASIAQARDTNLTMDVLLNISSTADATAYRSLDFGTIDLDPAGDSFEIDAASLGDTTTVKTSAGSSLLSGVSHSGIIRVVGNTSFNVTVTYPTTVTLTGTGPQVDVLDITSLSQAPDSGTGINHTGGASTDIYVGGRIVLTGDEDGSYTGTMPLTVHFN